MESTIKNKKKKVIMVGMGIATTGLFGYFGWQYYQRKKRQREEEKEDTQSKLQLPPQRNSFNTGTFTQQTRNDDFPLKKGSKGTRVKALQEALITKYGKDILPRYGADGGFGNETVTALRKANLPETIDESTFNVLVKTATGDSKTTAGELYKGAVNKNLDAVISGLKKMRSKEDYNSVNSEFKKFTLRGVSQTIVNGLLGSFSDESQKQQIRLEFLRMGLKYDGSKWSLSGLDGFTVITHKPALVWKNQNEGAKVPAQMILGTEIAQRGKYTLFENNGQQFIVETTSIKYL